jgi:hypothetical protein
MDNVMMAAVAKMFYDLNLYSGVPEEWIEKMFYII